MAHPFRGLILGCAVAIALVAAFDLLVLLIHPAGIAPLPAFVLSAVLALAGLIAIVALTVAGRRRRDRVRLILAGDYILRWHYASGEWRQFVAQERAVSLRVAAIFLPITLGCVALLLWLGRIWGDSYLGDSLIVFIVLAGVFLVVLYNALSPLGAFARRARAVGDTYISALGILCPDGLRPLRGPGYHLAAVDVVRGRPSRLRLRLRLDRAGKVLAFIGRSPTQWDIRVPIPFGREFEADHVAALIRTPGFPR